MVLERLNIEIRYLRFKVYFDIEGKNYDIVPDIVPDIVSDMVYINLTCQLEHADPSLSAFATDTG